MAKKISELATATSLGDTDKFPIVQGGVTKNITWKQARAFALVAGACMLEQFDVNAGSGGNDQAAFVAAMDLVKAGTCRALVLGGKTYNVDGYEWDGGAGNGGAIFGIGPKSVLKYRIATVDLTPGISHGRTSMLLLRNVDTILLRDFTVEGDGVLSQRGILAGIADSTAPQKLTLDNVFFKNLRLSSIHTTNAPNPTSQVATMKGCRVEGAGTATGCIGIVGGAQMILDATDTSGCGIGWQFSAGNLTATGCVTDNNEIGLQLVPSGNDGHGTVTGCTFNHNTVNLEVQGIANGMTFGDSHFYAGEVKFKDNAGIVSFGNCSLRPSAAGITFDNSLVHFVDTRIETSASPAINELNNPRTEFVRVVDLDGTVPSFVRDRVQMSFTFAADANDTLTKQESVAETLIVASGVITATRDIVSALAPAGAKSRQIRIVNNNAQSVVFKWSSGTGITVASGAQRLIGSDGTNAIQLGT